MPRPANVEKTVNTETVENTTVNAKPTKTLDECRKNAKINIMLPAALTGDENDLYEFVTVNGVTTQIRRGEKVAVNWLVFEALTNPKTGKYPRTILA